MNLLTEEGVARRGYNEVPQHGLINPMQQPNRETDKDTQTKDRRYTQTHTYLESQTLGELHGLHRSQLRRMDAVGSKRKRTLEIPGRLTPVNLRLECSLVKDCAVFVCF